MERARREEAAPAPLDAAFKLVDSLPVPVFFKSRDGRYLGVNRAWEEFFGIPGSAFVGRQVAELYPQAPAVAEKHAAMDRELYANPGRQSYEIAVPARDGSLRDTLYYKATYTDASGEVAGLIGAIVDITARKRAEAALAESEMRFRETFELAASGIAHVDLDGRFLRVNRSLCEILGYAEAELVGRTVKDISHPEDRDVTDAERLRVRRGEIPVARFEKRYLRRDGRPVWVELAVALARSAEGAPLYEIAIFDDITERRNAENALRESEERYRRTFELAGSGVAHVSLEQRFLRVNARLCEFLGYGEQELVGMSVADISHPEDRGVVNAGRSQLLAGLRDSIRVEKRYLRKDGSVVWASVAVAMQRDAAGRPQYAISILDDITARKKAEDALRESEERYRRTFELAGSGVAHIGLDRRFIRVNRRLCEILGYPEHELIGLTGRQISHPDDLDVINSQRPQLYRGEIDHVQVEKRYVRKDGSTVWVTFSMVVERDAEGRPLYEIAIFDDITERKEADRALREAHEELKRSNAELEQFAYVASHDLQEPLRMVASYTQLLARRYGERLDGDAKEFMHYIVDGAARMKQLIEDLLAYSRVGTHGKAFNPVALEAPLRKAIGNLRAAIEESNAAVTWDALPTVSADELQLAQLFQNLIGNALKFRGAGVPRVHVSALERKDECEIVVADNGIGIEPQYFERIFMVFQRLHTMGEYPGTGIGLAICKKVIERHGGRIWVASTPGAGSEFHFTLQKKENP